jgi:hypothetical protein
VHAATQPAADAGGRCDSVGNHESYLDYISYNNRFDMLGNRTGGNHNFWCVSSPCRAAACHDNACRHVPAALRRFSFDFGDVHVTSMSTEHDYSTGSEQYLFIEKARASFLSCLFTRMPRCCAHFFPRLGRTWRPRARAA